MKLTKRSLFAAVAAALLALAVPQLQHRAPQTPERVTAPATSYLPVEQAQRKRLSDVWVEGEGVVVKVLPDDDRGHRHQRFLVRLPNRKTVLIVHNIDLAPRVPRLVRGEKVRFAGEYVYNPKGGLVHWTHHDPSGRRMGGWLEVRGRRYR
jgi:hypothetical protein